jgi:hypothetical protein
MGAEIELSRYVAETATAMPAARAITVDAMFEKI